MTAHHRRRLISDILRRHVREFAVEERNGRWALRNLETGQFVEGASDETKVSAEVRARDEIAKAIEALLPAEGGKA